jgi:arylsulfatase A-like enzyme
MRLPNRPDDFAVLQTLVNRCQNRYKYRDHGFDLNLVRTIKAYYYACISFVDYQIGRLLDALEASGQLEQTMIIFTADHGEHLGDYQCFGKRSMHDSCARIPMIIAWPERFAPGGICDEPASLVDIAPTLLAAASTGIESHKLDGVDLHLIASGKINRPYVFGQLSLNMSRYLEADAAFNKQIADPVVCRAVFSSYMAVSRDWKFFYSAPDNQAFLFDKRTDNQETRNVADSPFAAEPLKKLRTALLDHLAACGETGGIQDGAFIPFNVPPLKRNPDAGHLIQDHYTPWAPQHLPGYHETD